jgi:hypothetical protein
LATQVKDQLAPAGGVSGGGGGGAAAGEGEAEGLDEIVAAVRALTPEARPAVSLFCS